jgi:hypothetical protein
LNGNDHVCNSHFVAESVVDAFIHNSCVCVMMQVIHINLDPTRGYHTSDASFLDFTLVAVAKYVCHAPSGTICSLISNII